MAIKTGFSGAVELDGKFSNGETKVFIVLADVKAEPHQVQTATKGEETKMGMRLIAAIEPEDPKLSDMLTEMVKAAQADRDPEMEGQDSLDIEFDNIEEILNDGAEFEPVE